MCEYQPLEYVVALHSSLMQGIFPPCGNDPESTNLLAVLTTSRNELNLNVPLDATFCSEPRKPGRALWTKRGTRQQMQRRYVIGAMQFPIQDGFHGSKL